MHLVITISQFPLTQFQKTNNKEIQLPLKIKYKYFFLKAFSSMNYQRKELSNAQSHFKKEKSMAAGKTQVVKMSSSTCPGKNFIKNNNKNQKSLLSKNLFLPSIVRLMLCKTKEENILLNCLDRKDREGTSFQIELEKLKKFRINT